MPFVILRTLDLPLLLNTSDHDLFRDFFVPAMTHALRYDRGVDYFASGWLRLTGQGIVAFAGKRGGGCWLCYNYVRQNNVCLVTPSMQMGE